MSSSSSSIPAYGMSPVNCTTYPPLEANPDISGIGVTTSFLATAYLTFFSCVAKFILGRLERKATDESAQRFARWSFALESAIMSFSDQQLVTGISIIVGGLQQLAYGLPVYYFLQVGNLAWFSTMTHILTLTVLRDKMREKSSPTMRILRVVLMGCLAVLLCCAMAPIGYITSAYGGWGYIDTAGGFDTANGLNTTGNLNRAGGINTTGDLILVELQGPIPMTFPAWCLYHPSLDWVDEGGRPILHQGTYGYNTIYGVFTLGIILYAYTSRVLLFFPGFISRSTLRVPSGQPWLALRSTLETLQKVRHTKAAPITRSIIFVRMCAWLGYVLLYSFCILIISGKQVYGSRIWELTWLAMAIAWGTIRLFMTPWDNDSFPFMSQHIPFENVFSSQNVWGFGQVVALVLLLLPFLSFTEEYLNFNKDSPSLSRAPSNASRHPSLLSPDDGLQHEIYSKRWYECLIVLWYLTSAMIGLYALSYVAAAGGASLSPLNQQTAVVKVHRTYSIYPLWAGLLLFSLGLIWMFILSMLPEWSFLSHKSLRIAVTFAWVAMSGIWIYVGGWFLQI